MSFIYTELSPDFVDDGSTLAEAIKKTVREARKAAGMEPCPRAEAPRRVGGRWPWPQEIVDGVARDLKEIEESKAKFGGPETVASRSGAPRQGHVDGDKPAVGPVKENGQHEDYWVLSKEELGKGFCRPFRKSYTHVGEQPKYPLRDLSNEEKERYHEFGYIAFEKYPEDDAISGRYWTQRQLDGGCRAVTTVSDSIAATYARSPDFYGATFCTGCNDHHPVAEFRWVGDNEVVGS